VSHRPQRHFDSIESAHQYVAFIVERADEALGDVEADMRALDAGQDARRIEALQLAAYKLHQLKLHLTRSRGVLNDLRTLRRLLFAERGATPEHAPALVSSARTR
jgi:hypothetical protein